MVRRIAPHIGGYGGSSPREVGLICAPDKMAVFAIGRTNQQVRLAKEKLAPKPFRLMPVRHLLLME